MGMFFILKIYLFLILKFARLLAHNYEMCNLVVLLFLVTLRIKNQKHGAAGTFTTILRSKILFGQATETLTAFRGLGNL